MTETARDIDDAAAAWAIRLDESGSNPRVKAEVDQWLAGDPRRTGALLRAQAALHLVDQSGTLSGKNATIPHEGLLDLSRRRMLWGGAMLAGLGGLGFLTNRQRFDTKVGEVRRIPLDDGSTATINTASRLAVEMEPNIRKVSLERGEAWFRVAKDPSRPFVVEAGDVRVRAVGTAFSVRRRAGGSDVLVTEGVVETWRAEDEGYKVRIGAGAKTFVADNPETQVIQPVMAKADIDRRLAWREGMISLHGETLAEAAAEFNRYNSRKIVIDNPSLASERVVGQFLTDEPDRFGQAIAITFDAQCTTDQDTIRLSRSNKR